MKSERQIRRHIKIQKDRLKSPDIGVREKAVCEAQIETLKWVVNKRGFDPESQAMDAFIDDRWTDATD